MNDIKDWDPRSQTLMVEIVINNYTYGIFRLSNKDRGQIEIFSIPKNRIPIVVANSVSYYKMAANNLVDTSKLTKDNAREMCKSLIQENEIMVEWQYGWFYYRDKSKIKRGRFNNWALLDVPKRWKQYE